MSKVLTEGQILVLYQVWQFMGGERSTTENDAGKKKGGGSEGRRE
jgi:hypothetical protein